MDNALMWQLEKAEGEKQCTLGDYAYYSVTINGYRLMYALNRYRPDGLKLYLFGDELAKCLGFYSFCDMRWRLRLRYHLKMLSVKALKRHLN